MESNNVLLFMGGWTQLYLNLDLCPGWVNSSDNFDGVHCEDMEVLTIDNDLPDGQLAPGPSPQFKLPFTS